MFDIKKKDKAINMIGLQIELFEKILTQWQNKLIFIQISKIIILKHEYIHVNSFDRSVKSWQFLGMIQVISFNSTGVGVYNSTCKCCKNELWSSLESCSQYFFNKNFMVSYGPFFSHLNILWMDTWMEPLTLTSTAQQSFLCYDYLHGWAAELSNWAGPNTIIVWACMNGWSRD